MFITSLADHLVHMIRYQFKLQGIHLCWDSIRNIMSTQQPISIILPADNNQTIYLRTTTKAEQLQKQIYDELNFKPDPLGNRKTMIDQKNVLCQPKYSKNFN